MAAPAGYRLRDRRAADDERLLSVENRAAELFRRHGYPQVADEPFPDVDELRGLFLGRRVRVAAGADDDAAGFAVSSPLGAWLHLHELSVDPAHGRKGVGSALVLDVVEEAGRLGLAGVSLTTFRDVPFNMPFYLANGFAECPLADAPEELGQVFHAEIPEGVSADRRVLMLRRTAAET